MVVGLSDGATLLPTYVQTPMMLRGRLMHRKIALARESSQYLARPAFVWSLTSSRAQLAIIGSAGPPLLWHAVAWQGQRDTIV